MEKANLISERLFEYAERLENIIRERERFFVLPEARGIRNVFLDGFVLSYEIISQDLSKLLAGLHGQTEAWKTGKFQGQAVLKEQLLSGFSILLRDWDKLMNAWNVYSISGDGMDQLKKIYDDVVTISFDAQQAPFPN